MRTIDQIFEFADRKATHFQWTNVIGIGRTVLALGSLITLLFNDINWLMHPLGLKSQAATMFNVNNISLFGILDTNLVLAKWIAIVILLLAASGWRPRFTAILHWWVAFSYANSAIVLDGGDQITEVLTLLLIPVCLADGRRWHWQKVSWENPTNRQKMLNTIAFVSLFMIRIQVAVVYFHAAVGKFEVDEWANGTAIYYWAQNPLFGLSGWLEPIFQPLLAEPLIVSSMTWGPVLLELLIFMGLTMHKKYHPWLLAAGLSFHFFIILLFGLVSFFCAMAGALILFLGPMEKGFVFKKRTKPDYSASEPEWAMATS